MRITRNVIFVIFILCCSTSYASYKSINRITFCSAYTLDRSEVSVGIFSPIQYGLTDDFMVATHPLMHLFLTPNAFLKYKILDRKVGLSLNLSYLETFLDPKRVNFPGSIVPSMTMTIPLKEIISINLTNGYVFEISPVAHGVLFSGAVNILFSDADLISVQMHNIYSVSYGTYMRPTVILMYSHAWEITRLNLGAAYGKFYIQTGDSALDIREISFYPVIDLWWQF
jgi:hypothetical protein